MADLTGSCVLLADRHHSLSEGVRGLLETAFDSVFMVGDEPSLLEGSQRLRPPVVIIDLALAAGDVDGLLGRVAERSPQSKVLVLTVHDEPSVADAALRAGAHGVVLKRAIATDLLEAIGEVLAGRHYVSPSLAAGRCGSAGS
jgi:DNA-binding NarL/FixJ family response regulator